MSQSLLASPVLLQVLLEQGVLSPPSDARLVCKSWTRHINSSQERVQVSHIEGDGSLLGGFLARLPKLDTVTFDKRFRSVPIRSSLPGGYQQQQGELAAAGEAHQGSSNPPSPAKRVPSGGTAEQHQHQHGSVREREAEKIKAACAALRRCACRGLSVSFCRLQHSDLKAILGAIAEGAGGKLESLDLSGNFFSLEGTRLLCSHADLFPSLTSLNIGSNDLNAAGIEALAGCKGLCGRLRSLDISENGLTREAAPALERLLAETTSLERLEIDHADWRAGYEGVFGRLAGLGALKGLRLRSAALGQEGGSLLSTLVRGSGSLTELSAPKNGLNAAAASALCEALSDSIGAMRCELATLDLSRNCIGPQGAAAIAGVLQSARALPLHRLDLSENQLGPDGALALAEALHIAAARPLERLNLGSNAMGPIGATAIAGALTSGARHGGLRDLDVSNNSLDASGASRICGVLPLCTQLERLDLSHNRAGAQAMEALGDSMMQGSHMSLSSLDLSYNDVGGSPSRDFDWISRVAGACPSLSSLELACNSLGDGACEAIAALIRHDGVPCLRKLGLAGNRITARGGGELARAFAGNRLMCFRMRTLDLSDNCFWCLDDEGEDTAESEREKVTRVMCEGERCALLPHQIVA